MAQALSPSAEPSLAAGAASAVQSPHKRGCGNGREVGGDCPGSFPPPALSHLVGPMIVHHYATCEAMAPTWSWAKGQSPHGWWPCKSLHKASRLLLASIFFSFSDNQLNDQVRCSSGLRVRENKAGLLLLQLTGSRFPSHLCPPPASHLPFPFPSSGLPWYHGGELGVNLKKADLTFNALAALLLFDENPSPQLPCNNHGGESRHRSFRPR